jgi:hypothetical protein
MRLIRLPNLIRLGWDYETSRLTPTGFVRAASFASKHYLISFAVHIEDLKTLFGSLLTTRVPTLAGVGCRRSHHARLRLLEPFQKDF